MNKKILVLFAFLGLFFLVPLSNYSVAAPADTVGVELGDSFKWTIKINAGTFAEFAEDVGETIDLEDLGGLEEMGSFYIKAEVISLTEDSTTVNETSVNYVEVNVTATMGIPGVGEEEIDYPIPVWVLSNETDYYLHLTFYAFWEWIEAESEIPLFEFLFIAYNLNWTKAVEDVNELYDKNPAYEDVVVGEEGNGFKITIAEGSFNASQKEIVFIMKYTSAGVLQLGKLSYDGATLMSITLGGGEGEIPSFDLLIIIGITSIVGIALISVINKRKKIVT